MEAGERLAKESCHWLRIGHAPAGEPKARLDVRRLQVRQLLDDLLGAEPVREQVEYVADADSHAPNARAAAALLGVYCYPIRQGNHYRLPSCSGLNARFHV